MHGWHQLYAERMDLELRHLRCLVAIADTGTFTDAGIELGISQAAVSRNLLALENLLGARLLQRTSRSVTPTTAGVHVLAQARQILAAAANLVSEATTGHTALRIGHAWSAMGRYTREFQRRWAAGHPETELQLIRVNSPTGGLAEGLCDVAVLRAAPAAGGHHQPVPARRRGLPAAARRTADRRPPHLAPPRPASRDVRRRRPAHRALPGEPGVTTPGPVREPKRAAASGATRVSGAGRAKTRPRSGRFCYTTIFDVKFRSQNRLRRERACWKMGA
jgi:DNA-binding transcriptional LysR family regulator